MTAAWAFPPPAPPLLSGGVPPQASPLPRSPPTASRRRRTPGYVAASSGPPSQGQEPRQQMAPPQKARNRSSSTGGPDSPPFLPQEDVDYLWKLGLGSVAGGAAIKYGSALFPEITRPSFVLALLMIGTPMLVAVVLLVMGRASGEAK